MLLGSRMPVALWGMTTMLVATEECTYITHKKKEIQKGNEQINWLPATSYHLKHGSVLSEEVGAF